MAPLRYQDTLYFKQTVVFRRKDSINQNDPFILKDISAGEVQSLYKSYLKDTKRLSLLKDLFGTRLTFKIVLDLEEF